MNQDQIKTLLLQLNPDVPDFSVIMTGKESKKVDGLYKPETAEILLHNRNFHSQEQLVYTAIHEFAHHVHFSSQERPTSSKAHTARFWEIFHRLLQKAEEKKLYTSIFLTEPEFVALTEKLKKQYLFKNGELMKELGQLLLEALELCRRHHTNFEDYLDRVLGVNRVTAKTVMTAFRQDLPPELGYDQMKFVSGLKNPETRSEVIQRLEQGETVDMIKVDLKAGPEPLVFDGVKNKLEEMERERRSLEQQLARTQQRLADLANKIEQLKLAEQEV